MRGVPSYQRVFKKICYQGNLPSPVSPHSPRAAAAPAESLRPRARTLRYHHAEHLIPGAVQRVPEGGRDGDAAARSSTERAEFQEPLYPYSYEYDAD